MLDVRKFATPISKGILRCLAGAVIGLVGGAGIVFWLGMFAKYALGWPIR